jgi:hypothetical protein
MLVRLILALNSLGIVLTRPLFEKDARADGRRCHGGIFSEGRTAPKPGPQIQPDRRFLVRARLKAEHGNTRFVRLRLDPLQHRLRDSAPARDLSDIHALYFGESGEEGHPSASHCRAVQTRQKESDVRLKERVYRHSMTFLWPIICRECLIEFADQSTHFVGFARNQFDRNVTHVVREPNLHSSGCQPQTQGTGRCGETEHVAGLEVSHAQLGSDHGPLE